MGEGRAVSVGRKESEGKPCFDSLSPAALLALGEVALVGSAKYGQHNYMNGINYSKLYSALIRHLLKWWGGEERDGVDGQHHLASVAWHALALLHYALHPDAYGGFDDRPHKLIERLKRDVDNPKNRL